MNVLRVNYVKFLLFIMFICLFVFSLDCKVKIVRSDSTFTGSTVATIGKEPFSEINLTVYGQNGYDYKSESEIYCWYVKGHSNWGDCNKFTVVYNGAEYFLVYQAQDHSYRDVDGAQDYISSIRDAIGSINGSKIRYNDVFSYVDLEYQTFYGMLKEKFIIHQLPRQPASYLKSPITLDFGGYVKFGNLKIFVNGEEKTGTSFVTGERIDFGLNSETILFYLPKPYAEDAVGNRVDCLYEVKLQGNQIWFYVRTPFEWLNDSSRVYPVVVDPSIVGTSSVSSAIQFSFQRKCFYANGRFWVFYSDGTNMVYRTSVDGTTWTSATSVRASVLGYYFSIWFDGTYVHYAYASSSSIYYRRGTPNSDGSITWSTANEQVVSTTYNTAYTPFISVDSYGYVWIAYVDYTGVEYYPYVIRSGNNDGTWGQTPSGFPYQLSSTSSPSWYVSVVPLTNGKMLTVYTYNGAVVRVRCWNGNSWNTEVTTTSTCYSGSYHSVVNEGDNVDIVFLKSTAYDILHVRYSYSTNSLSTEHTVIAGATSTSAPVLCRDYTSDTLYVFWATKTTGSPSGATANHIYYQTSINDGATWSSFVDWIDESAGVLTGSDRLTCFIQAYGSRIGLVYMSGTSVPYNVKFAYLLANNAPKIGEFYAPSTVYANKYFYLNCTINDADGATQFVNATVEISNGIILKWDNTNTFSIFQDSNGYCTLDASNSIRTQINTTAYKLSWRIKLKWSFPEGSVSVINTNTKVFDIYGASGSNSRVNLFTFEDDLIVASASVNDGRINPSQTISFTGRLYYEGTTIPPEDTNGITAKVNLGATTKGSTTTINSDGSFTISFYGETSVGLYSYTVYAVTDQNTVQNQTVNVIVDRIIVASYSVSDSRTNINDNVNIYATLKYEYDNVAVTTGTITINGYSATHIGSGVYRITRSRSTVGAETYNTVAGSESTYGLNTVNQNGKSTTVIWDRVNINVFTVSDNRINVGSSASFTVSGVYEYDLTTWVGSYTLNDTISKNNVGRYGYKVISITDNNYGLTAFRQTASDVYVIFDRVKVNSSGVIDERIDVNAVGSVWFELLYEYDLTPVSDGSVILFGSKQANYANGKWWRNESQSLVCSVYYNVSSVSGNIHGITVINHVAQTQSIIWDRVKVESSGVNDDRVNIGSYVTVYFVLKYEFDNALMFDGYVLVNGSSATFNSAFGRWELNVFENNIVKHVFFVSSVSGNTYGITVINHVAGYPSVVWDFNELNNFVFSGGTTFNMTVNVNSLYDGPLNNKNVKVRVYFNGNLFDEQDVLSDSSGHVSIISSRNLYANGTLTINITNLDYYVDSFSYSCPVYVYVSNIEVFSIDPVIVYTGDYITIIMKYLPKAQINGTYVPLSNVYWKALIYTDKYYGFYTFPLYNGTFANDYETKTLSFPCALKEGSYMLNMTFYICGSDTFLGNAETPYFVVKAREYVGGGGGGAGVAYTFPLTVIVRDSRGSYVSDVLVTVIDVYNATVYSGKTDSWGTVIAQLKPGTYNVTVKYDDVMLSETVVISSEPVTKQFSLPSLTVTPVTVTLDSYSILWMFFAFSGAIGAVLIERRGYTALAILLGLFTVGALLHSVLVMTHKTPPLFTVPSFNELLKLPSISLPSLSLDLSFLSLSFETGVLIVACFVVMFSSIYYITHRTPTHKHRVVRTVRRRAR